MLTLSANIITHEPDWSNGLVLRAAHPSFRGHRFLQELRVISKSCAKRIAVAAMPRPQALRASVAGGFPSPGTNLDRGDTVATKFS